MISGPQVFVDIDTQFDFLDPAGALFVPGSTEILDNLQRLTRFARERRIPILATADAHTPDDPELTSFPPHCMQGTRGQQRTAATQCPGSVVLTDLDPLPEKIPAHLTLNKRQFDLFSHPRADELVTRYLAGAPVFVVYGVATDYCVRAAVEGLLARGAQVGLVVDAIRAIDPAAESAILSRFARQGVLLTMTDVVCDPRSTISPPSPPVPDAARSS